MDITRDNFSDALFLFKESLIDCDFCAVDVEFSGIHVPGVDVSGCDIPEVRYHKLRQVVQNYGILQIGFCLFRRVSPGSKTLEPRAFNLWTLPQDVHVKGKTKCFSRPASWKMDAAAIQFLRETGFNFTQCFTKGVSYADAECEKSLDSFLSSSDFQGTTIEKENIRVKVLGARLFWSALLTSGVPLVLHNASFDFLFLMNYLEATLPTTLGEFLVLKVRRAPGIIFDTKVIGAEVAPHVPVESSLEILCQSVIPKGEVTSSSSSEGSAVVFEENNKLNKKSSASITSTAISSSVTAIASKTKSKSLNIGAPSFRPSPFKADAPSFFPSFDATAQSIANSTTHSPSTPLTSLAACANPSTLLNQSIAGRRTVNNDVRYSGSSPSYINMSELFAGDALLDLAPPPPPFTKYNDEFYSRQQSQQSQNTTSSNNINNSLLSCNQQQTLKGASTSTPRKILAPSTTFLSSPTTNQGCFYHEAAFDALQTGRLLLALRRLAGEAAWSAVVHRLAGHIHLKRCVWTLNTFFTLNPIYSLLEVEGSPPPVTSFVNADQLRPIFDSSTIPPPLKITPPSNYLPSLYTVYSPDELKSFYVSPHISSTDSNDLLVLVGQCSVMSPPWASPLALACLVDVQPGLRTSGVLDALDVQPEPPASPTASSLSTPSPVCAPGGSSAKIQIRWSNDLKMAIVSSAVVRDLEERLSKLTQANNNINGCGVMNGTAPLTAVKAPFAQVAAAAIATDQWPSLSSLSPSVSSKDLKRQLANNTSTNPNNNMSIPVSTTSGGSNMFEVRSIRDFLSLERARIEETFGTPGISGVASFLMPPPVNSPLIFPHTALNSVISPTSIASNVNNLNNAPRASIINTTSVNSSFNLNSYNNTNGSFHVGATSSATTPQSHTGGYNSSSMSTPAFQRKPPTIPSPVIVAKNKSVISGTGFPVGGHSTVRTVVGGGQVNITPSSILGGVGGSTVGSGSITGGGILTSSALAQSTRTAAMASPAGNTTVIMNTNFNSKVGEPKFDILSSSSANNTGSGSALPNAPCQPNGLNQTGGVAILHSGNSNNSSSSGHSRNGVFRGNFNNNIGQFSNNNNRKHW